MKMFSCILFIVLTSSFDWSDGACKNDRPYYSLFSSPVKFDSNGFPCSQQARITFNSEPLVCGQCVDLAAVENKPDVSMPTEPNKLYTLVMLDPDAPSRRHPTFRSWLHWLVVNIGDSDRETDVVQYNPPSPPKGYGVHRYIVLLFEQGGIAKTQKLFNKRNNFDIDLFVDNSNLIPAGSFYFKAERT